MTSLLQKIPSLGVLAQFRPPQPTDLQLSHLSSFSEKWTSKREISLFICTAWIFFSFLFCNLWRNNALNEKKSESEQAGRIGRFGFEKEEGAERRN